MIPDFVKASGKSLATLLERRCLERYSGTLTPPMLVVLGVPRSGTTLVYQALVHHWHWAYFCSLVERRLEWPTLATLLAKRKIRSYQSTFQSEHGSTEAVAGPAEARDLWAQWFGWERSSLPQEVAKQQHMTQVVCALCNVVDAPFLTKNPDHCLHIPKLEAGFPGVLYLYVRRHREDTARSLLHARLKEESDWFGAKPPGWEHTKTSPLPEQVLFQVDALARIAEDDLVRVPRERRLEIQYEEFCEQPAALMQVIEAFLSRHQVRVRPKAALPNRFHRSKGRPLAGDLEQAFLDALPR